MRSGLKRLSKKALTFHLAASKMAQYPVPMYEKVSNLALILTLGPCVMCGLKLSY